MNAENVGALFCLVFSTNALVFLRSTCFEYAQVALVRPKLSVLATILLRCRPVLFSLFNNLIYKLNHLIN